MAVGVLYLYISYTIQMYTDSQNFTTCFALWLPLSSYRPFWSKTTDLDWTLQGQRFYQLFTTSTTSPGLVSLSLSFTSSLSYAFTRCSPRPRGAHSHCLSVSRVSVAGRPVSCKPLDSFFTPSDWTRHDCTACRVHQKMVNSCRQARYSG